MTASRRRPRRRGPRPVRVQIPTDRAGFDPSDSAHDDLLATIEDLGVPCVFTAGNSTLGACSPGGRGLKVKYGNQILLDDVAADYPDLQILIAHPAFPWEKAQLAICQ